MSKRHSVTELTEQDFWRSLQRLQDHEPPVPVYRLYYDDAGVPLFYSQEHLPGNYIELDVDVWHAGSFNLRIQDGIIQYLQRPAPPRLQPGDSGTACDPRDICVVVTQDRPHKKWSLR